MWFSLQAPPRTSLSELLAFGVFRETGDWTLTAELTPDTLPQMDEVFDFILDQMDKFIGAQ
jgi:hypothetical protein